MKSFGLIGRLVLGAIALNVSLSYADDTEQDMHFQRQQRHSEWQKRAAMHFVSQFPVKGNEDVLDLGSGDGKVSAYLSIRIPDGSVLGVDVEDNFVKEAQETYTPTSFPNLRFSRGNATNLTLDKQFDLVTAFTTMHLIEDKGAAFRSIKRSLKPGGRALLQCPLSHGLGNALGQLVQRPKWKAYFQNFNDGWHYADARTYEKYLSNAQLEARYFKISRLDEVYESEQAFKDSLSTWLPHCSVLSEDKCREFLEELVELYVEEVPFDSEGRVHFYVDRLEVEAVHPNLEPRFKHIASEDPLPGTEYIK